MKKMSFVSSVMLLVFAYSADISAQCSSGVQISSDCQNVEYEGCCNGAVRVWCENGALCALDCTEVPQCGWDDQASYYNCGTGGSADPSGNNPLSCETLCTGSCVDKECGDDGCGGSCGTCSGANMACENNKCVCQPDCTGKECGDDGCGGSCGSCSGANMACENNKCVCQPDCTGKECGDDGCGGSCGVCGEGFGCLEEHGKCVPAGCYPTDTPGCNGCACEECVFAMDSYCKDYAWDKVCVAECNDSCGGNCPCFPDCTGKECGDDGCGGECGTCTEGAVCYLGSCCVPDCTGKKCGDDGCGGSCGVCEEGLICSPDGTACVEPVGCKDKCGGQSPEGCFCDELCFENADCCPNICDECGDLYTEQCCKPVCEGKECGDDGCGGSCGVCGAGMKCGDDFKCVACDPKCAGKVCGDDGFGCSCGVCGPDELCISGKCFPATTGCGGLTFEGCCDDKTVVWCENDQIKKIECGKNDPPNDSCGWRADAGYYDCGGTGEDPSGQHPIWCVEPCQPDCTNKECGDNGCNGSCGTCNQGYTCVNFKCVEECTPDCANKECGDNGCNGSCGSCGEGEVCVNFKCCQPDCTNKECGDDGCGGSCGSCSGANMACENNICVCKPDCTNKECGDDGCNDSCGTCGEGKKCENNKCVSETLPDEFKDVIDQDAVTSDAVAEKEEKKGGGGCAHGAPTGYLPSLLLIALFASVALVRRYGR